VKPNPANHSTFTIESCVTCHKPAAQATATPAAGATATAEATTAPTSGVTATPAAAGTSAPAVGGPKPIPANHDLTSAAYEDCTLCHGQGKIKPVPANHASYTADMCQSCHKPAAASAATPAAGPTSAATATTTTAATATVAATAGATATPIAAATAAPTASGPKPIPANHDLTSAAYKDCTLCHGEGKVKPNPANHATFTLESCQICHKPAVQ
jgi:hypothetical protein